MTFTKEQLIERCEEAIASLKPCTGLAETKSLACFEIALSALASLEAERGKVRRFDIDVCDMVEDLDGEYVLFEDVLPYLNQYADYTHPQPLTTSERAELENYRNAQQVVPGDVTGPLEYAYKELTPHFMRNHISVFERYGIYQDGSAGIQAMRIALDVMERRAAMQSGAVKDGWVESSVDTAQVQFESLAGNSPVIPDGWVACSEANSALVMLDRIETTDPADDDRIDDVKRIIRELSQPRKNPQCWCRTCWPVSDSNVLFSVCPECGNKRCPHANDHRNACTGSNEPGQEGSAYPAAPQQEAE